MTRTSLLRGVSGLSLCILMIGAVEHDLRAQPVSIAEQEGPSAKPFLRIDPGMHTAPIRRVAANADCTLLATGSEDKSIRLWRIASNKLLPMVTLRPPIGPDNDGKVYTVAVAPDGSWVAAGGWNRTGGDHWIYIFRTATGEILTRLGRFQVIENLAVSRDGRRLAAAVRGKEGLRVWEKLDEHGARWRQVLQSRTEAKSEIKGIAFDSSGALYAASYDGRLRRYRPSLRGEPRVVLAKGGYRPYAVAPSPDGTSLAVGYADRPNVDIYDAQTLALRASLNTVDMGHGHLGSVAWSNSGGRLYAGGAYARNGRFNIREWQAGGQWTFRDIEGPLDSILDLVPCGDGVAIAGGDPAFGIVGADGMRLFWHSPVGADMRGKLGERFLVSRDGSRVRFPLDASGERPVLFDLRLERITDSPMPSSDLIMANVDGLPLADWEGGVPKLEGRPLQLDKHEKAQSIAISDDRGRFVVGTNYYLRAYARDGNQLWKRQAPGIVWGVNIAHEGLLVAALGDGTLRWYRMETGEELLALYVLAEDRRWVAWTPSGYFSASVGGENLIGWQVNRGWTEAPDFYPASRFRSQLYRPDIVTRVLAELNEMKGVRRANMVIQRSTEVVDVKKILPPVVQITTPSDFSPVSGNDVTLQYVLRSPSGLAIRRVFAEISGRPIEGTERRDVILTHGEFSGSMKVVLPAGDVAVSIVAETDEIEPRRSEAAIVNLLRVGSIVEPNRVQPRLYALIVGVGKYQDPSLDLGEFTGADADRVAQTLKLQEGSDLAFEKVETRILKHQEATKEAIEIGLQWLLDQVKDRDDIALFYFSGHGMTVTASSSFILPHDHKPSMLVRALNKQTVLQYLDAIPGRVIVLIDACYASEGLLLATHPGAQRLVSTALINEFAERGIISFASSSGKERSYAEGDVSYFTKALIEGLKGQGREYPSDTRIMTTGLGTWVTRRVNGLSGGKQTPILLTSPLSKPLSLAVLR